MLRTSRILKTITAILFVATLLITYSYIAQSVNVFLDPDHQYMMKIESLFYIALAVFIGLSFLFFIFDRVIDNYKKRKLQNSFFTSEYFHAWIQWFNAAINISLITTVLFIGFINSNPELNLLNFIWVLFIGPLAILLALLALPVFYSKWK